MTKTKKDTALQQKLLQILERQALIRVRQWCVGIDEYTHQVDISVVVSDDLAPHIKTRRLYYVTYTGHDSYKYTPPKLFREILDPRSQFGIIRYNWGQTDTAWLTGASEVIRRSVNRGQGINSSTTSPASVLLLPHYACLELLLQQAMKVEEDVKAKELLEMTINRFHGFVKEQQQHWRKLLS